MLPNSLGFLLIVISLGIIIFNILVRRFPKVSEFLIDFDIFFPEKPCLPYITHSYSHTSHIVMLCGVVLMPVKFSHFLCYKKERFVIFVIKITYTILHHFLEICMSSVSTISISITLVYLFSIGYVMQSRVFLGTILYCVEIPIHIPAVLIINYIFHTIGSGHHNLVFVLSVLNFGIHYPLMLQNVEL